MARILIADDEPAIAEVIRIVCEMDEHEVHATDDVAGAVKDFIDFDPELMILDLHFKPAPGGGAREILAKLDRLGGTRDCAVIIVTGFTRTDAADLAGQERVVDVVVKPFDIMDLRNAIRRVFGMPPVPPEAAR